MSRPRKSHWIFLFAMVAVLTIVASVTEAPALSLSGREIYPDHDRGVSADRGSPEGPGNEGPECDRPGKGKGKGKGNNGKGNGGNDGSPNGKDDSDR